MAGEMNVDALLVGWGIWSRNGNHLGLHAKSQMEVVMSLVQSDDLREASAITDEQALVVDRAVGSLKKIDVKLYDVIVWTYVWKYGQREVASRLKISRDAAAKLIERACGCIEYAIFFKDVA